MSPSARRERQRLNREHGRIAEAEVRAAIRREAENLGYRPDSEEPEEQQAYQLLVAAMLKYEMTPAQADAYLEHLFATQVQTVTDALEAP